MNALTKVMTQLDNKLVAIKKPGILVGAGFIGLAATIALSIVGTHKADTKINKKKSEMNVEKLSFTDTMKTCWTCYIPAACMLLVTVPCFIVADRARKLQYSAAIGLLNISQTAYTELKESIKKNVDDSTAKDIIDEHADKTSKAIKEKNTVCMSNESEWMFYEPISGRYFKSTWNKIQKAANDVNARAMKSLDGELTCSDWFEALGLEPTSSSDDMGWKVWDKMLRISPSATMSADNTPCGAIYYDTECDYLRK